MENNKVSIFLACAPKDYFKLYGVVNSLLNNLDNIEDIHVCTPNKIIPLNINFDISYHLDKEILPFVDPFKWKFRPNWIFQQMLKLFQNVTKNNYFVTFDCDCVLNRKLDLFNKTGNPIWYIGWEQNFQPYFTFSKKMFDFGRIAEHTFIADMNFFNKKIINEMLEKYQYTPRTFIEKSYDIVSLNCHIAEPEIYGNFCTKYHPKLYEIRRLKQLKTGKFQDDCLINNWTKEEILKTYIENKDNDYDVIQYQTWCVDSKNYWSTP